MSLQPSRMFGAAKAALLSVNVFQNLVGGVQPLSKPMNDRDQDARLAQFPALCDGENRTGNVGRTQAGG